MPAWPAGRGPQQAFRTQAEMQAGEDETLVRARVLGLLGVT